VKKRIGRSGKRGAPMLKRGKESLEEHGGLLGPHPKNRLKFLKKHNLKELDELKKGWV